MSRRRDRAFIRAFCGTLLVFGLLASGTSAQAAPPEVSISYSPALDTICSFARWDHIKTAWKREIAGDVGQFKSIWAETGPKLLRAAEQITGRAFVRSHITAHLTLCNVPSQSIIGISVNMRYALNSFTPHPVPMRYKVGVLFHEILHRYVDQYIPSHSALLARHAGESPPVRKHLHLLALEKAVYVRLGMKSALDETIAIDSRLPDPSYARAWQIINKSDDEYLAYIAELKAGGDQ